MGGGREGRMNGALLGWAKVTESGECGGFGSTPAGLLRKQRLHCQALGNQPTPFHPQSTVTPFDTHAWMDTHIYCIQKKVESKRFQRFGG